MSRAQSGRDIQGGIHDAVRHHNQAQNANAPRHNDPQPGSELSKEEKKQVGLRLRIWYTMENPNYGLAAKIWSTLVMATILLSSASFITQSLPEYYTEPPTEFYILEIFCVIIFTLEYVMRWITMPSFDDRSAEEGPTPKEGDEAEGKRVETFRAYSRARLVFMRQPMNIIDLMAILPFYVEEIVSLTNPEGGDSGASSLAVIRIVRIARVFRLLKLGKHNEGLEILVQTMKASWSFLVSVMFLVVILQVLFGSLIFYAETSSLDCVQSFSCMGGPDDGRECTLLELPEVGPDGKLTDKTVFEVWSSVSFASKTASGQPVTENNTIPIVRLPNSSRADPTQCHGQDGQCVSVGNICFMADGSVTLFNSIPITMWWALVTMCCVGFGDLRPVTTLGQFIGAFTAITGVIVLAMPTTVIGTNFSDIYDNYYEAKERKEQEAQAEKEQKDGEQAVNRKAKGASMDQKIASLDPTSFDVSNFDPTHDSSRMLDCDSSQDSGSERGDLDQGDVKERGMMQKELQRVKQRDDEVLAMIKKWNISMAVDNTEWEQLRARALLAGLIQMEELGDAGGV